MRYDLTVRNRGDCFNSKIFILKNIVIEEEIPYLIMQEYCSKEPMFEFPISSEDLGIYKLSNLGTDYTVEKLSNITCKYILVPCSNYVYGVPLLNSDVYLH